MRQLRNISTFLALAALAPAGLSATAADKKPARLSREAATLFHLKVKPAPKGKVTGYYFTTGHARNLAGNLPPGTGLHVITRKDQRRPMSEGGTLPAPERDALFRRLGLEAKVARMDEYEKDSLVLSARSFTLPEMRREYPGFSEKQLSALQKAARRIK